MNLKFGCDPEFFAYSPTYGVISPAILIEQEHNLKPIEMDEKHPKLIRYENEFMFHMDGVAFELTVLRPCETWKELYKIVNNSLDALETLIAGLTFRGEPLQLYKRPVVNITPGIYDLSKKLVEQGFIYGCDPDKDATNPNYFCHTVDASQDLFRYGGGHIHISSDENIFDLRLVQSGDKKEVVVPRPVILMQVLTTGLFTLKESLYPEEERIRALRYGQPGRYRGQLYGLNTLGFEYRTPSNSWCSLPEEKFEELFHWVTKGARFFVERKFELLDNFLEDACQAVINGDKSMAVNLLKEISYA